MISLSSFRDAFRDSVRWSSWSWLEKLRVELIPPEKLEEMRFPREKHGEEGLPPDSCGEDGLRVARIRMMLERMRMERKSLQVWLRSAQSGFVRRPRGPDAKQLCQDYSWWTRKRPLKNLKLTLPIVSSSTRGYSVHIIGALQGFGWIPGGISTWVCLMSTMSAELPFVATTFVGSAELSVLNLSAKVSTEL